jgi:hypothetical protein
MSLDPVDTYVYGRFLQDQLSIVVSTNCRGAGAITLLEGVAAHYLAPVQTQDEG